MNLTSEHEKGIGQYDLEYKNCPCFWGNEPGKFVKNSIKYLSGNRALDLGAGEGKNAIFLAEKGYTVDAIEVSYYATSNFKNQLDKLDSKVQSKINIIQADVTKLTSSEKYDVVVAYGLLHCLASISDVDNVIDFIKASMVINGIAIIVAFNNQIKVPKVQDYLEPTLLPANYLRTVFGSGWDILEYEDDIITETHPTSQVEHQHSLSRLIAKRIS